MNPATTVNGDQTEFKILDLFPTLIACNKWHQLDVELIAKFKVDEH